MQADKTNLRRSALGVLVVIVVGAIIVLAARCSPPSTITPPHDALSDINAVGAGINAITAWAPDSSPQFVRIDRSGADPDARIVTAALLGSGEMIQVSVSPDEDLRWLAAGPPQPVAAPPQRPPRALNDQPPSDGNDAWLAASEFLRAYLVGDTTEVRAWTSSRYDPDPLLVTYPAVTITRTEDPVAFPADRIAFVPIEYATTADAPEEPARTWRSWVAVRELDGRWFVEGMYATEPTPAPEQTS